MENKVPDLETIAIVIVGDFNPAIFHPSWFSKEGLISEGEADSAEIKLVHSNYSSFSLDWLKFEVTRNQMVFSSHQEAYYLILKDLAVGVFSLLYHTPINSFGINYFTHYRMRDRESYEGYFNAVAPFQFWDGIIEKPIVTRLSIKTEKRWDSMSGEINIAIEPSAQVDNGIFIHTNDHYELSSIKSSLEKIEVFMNIVKENWSSCFSQLQLTNSKIISK